MRKYFYGGAGAYASNGFDGDPRAPWKEPSFTECPNCGGDGILGYQDGSEEISLDEYDKLPEEEQEWYIPINCERCEGTGKILDD